MPEGPECTRTARQVNRAVQGKQLVNINFVSGRYTKKLPIGFGDFYIALEEQHLPVKCVTNKGKFIYWEFGDLLPICWMYTTLGMTGNFKTKPSKHTRIAFYFDDDSSIYYNDQRNFGTVKFVFDGCDRWLRLCWYAMGIDKRSTEVKQMPMKWGKRNTEYENLIEKITDGLECDRFFITHMKDEYAHNNPNPIGRVVNIKESTMDKMNQVIEVKTNKLGTKQTSTATVVASKTNTELVGKSFDFLTIDDGEVTWNSIEQLQTGEL